MRRFSLLVSLLAVCVAVPAQAQSTLMPASTTYASSAASGATAPAAAPAAGATMDNNISVWGILGYRYSAGSGWGLGARYQKVVVPEGFLKLTNGVRDELGVEGGIDYTSYSWNLYGYGWTYNEFDILVGVTWNFWLNPKLCLYPKLDLGFGFGSWSSSFSGANPSGYGGVYFQGAAGIVYKLSRVSLRAEVGSSSLRAGVSFAF